MTVFPRELLVSPSYPKPSELRVDSVIGELPLHQATLDMAQPGHVVADCFRAAPSLPGVILRDACGLVGILSRQQFLEYLLKPGGQEIFWESPLSTLWAYAQIPPLLFPAATLILTAAQHVLRRPVERQNEPIGVEREGHYFLLNVHELQLAHWRLRGIETQIRYERTQAQILQSEKMATLGRLVDGVAHEILDPVGFIWGNLAHVAAYTQDLLKLINAYHEALPSPPSQLVDLRESLEIDYLCEDLPNTMKSIQSGANRLKTLATSLQTFCHIDEVHPRPVDLHTIIDSAVLLLKSHITSRVDIIRNYGPLPPVACFGGQLSQVFMNILSTSLDMLLEQGIRQDIATQLELALRPQPSSCETMPTITIATQIEPEPTQDKRWVSVTVSDTGPGISEADYQEIVKGLSSKRRRLKETSLAASYRVVTAKHRGQFQIRSRQFADNGLPPGIGTEFKVRLPFSMGLATAT